MRPLFCFAIQTHVENFPDPELALVDPNGLLALGGDLHTARLLSAYKQGIFPWYNDGQPILWWSPNPRCVMFVDDFHVSRSLTKSLRGKPWRISINTAFERVLEACSGPRRQADGTWITQPMKAAYMALHQDGHAHSIEVWLDEKLVGGMYGVCIGKLFFGESMFSHETDASKVAFYHLVQQLRAWQFELIDCQVHSDHLERLGAVTIPRAEFLSLVERLVVQPAAPWPAPAF